MRCQAACGRKATTWWGWGTYPNLLKAALCPQCRRKVNVKVVSLGKVKHEPEKAKPLCDLLPGSY